MDLISTGSLKSNDLFGAGVTRTLTPTFRPVAASPIVPSSLFTDAVAASKSPLALPISLLILLYRWVRLVLTLSVTPATLPWMFLIADSRRLTVFVTVLAIADAK